MSNENHDMDEDMGEEGQMPRAWAGMNLREQIKGKLARYDAFLMDVAEGPSGQSATGNVLEHTRNEDAFTCTSPAEALYRLFILTAIEVTAILLRDHNIK
ncbi:hypothetical protein E2P81_ATG04066 [Venturia nashicola]|uniref:Uncharacterized protein n=1 Tax=Venturia nashicola TaxID=86259 RepID=A0A4Z1PPZ2_9PEZI|nr:hypothetical protein E6O75_ATG04167 [Venturia nashicola]TLD37254.1 hypothetical protein E2P81_ATG04066 [Venturia nashicola]